MIFSKIKKSYYVFFIGLFFVANLMFSISSAEAKSNINFDQSIIPVKFVYLDKYGDIENIWSNVRNTDTVYVVKFFSKKYNKEVSMNDSYISEFKSNLSRVENINKKTLSVDFVKNGNVLEEVHTYV